MGPALRLSYIGEVATGQRIGFGSDVLRSRSFCIASSSLLAAAVVVAASPAWGLENDSDLRLLERILDTPEASIDLAAAKIAIDRMIDPTIDAAGTIEQLDSMAALVKSWIPAGASSHEKMESLRKYLYEAGPWNGHRPFKYDLDDPMGRRIANKLLPNYLATRKGNCVSMPFLFVILGQKIGIDVTASTAPEHVFVKFRDEKGRWFNVEATSGGGFTSDGWIQKQMPMTGESLKNGIYMRPLTRKESVATMASTLMEFYGQQGQQENRIALATLVLKHHPKSVDAMLHIHGAYGGMIRQEFQSRYASPRQIPVEARARYRQLNEGARVWRE